MLKLLFATLGTLGDIKPSLAIAKAAALRGHEVTFATTNSFRSLVERLGIPYVSFGSDDYLSNSGARSALLKPTTGFSSFMAMSNLDDMEAMFWRLDQLTDQVDGIVSTPFVMAAHLIAQKKGLPLVSCATSPAVLLSNWRGAATDCYAAEWRTRLNGLRTCVGLPRRSFPQMERFSADLMLGIYPKCLSQTGGPFIRTPCEVGYPSLDEGYDDVDGADEELLAWMAERGCVLVSFGSFVDERAAEIFDDARNACAALGLRLLFVSKYRAKDLRRHQSTDVRVEQFVPHWSAMKRAAVVVHHCGVGSLAAAAAAGRPMLVVPFGLDQVYNAEVLKERNLAEVLPYERITGERFCEALARTIDQWPLRESLWGIWLDEGRNSSAETAAICAEAVVQSSSARQRDFRRK